MNILAIDPGLTGAIALIRTTGAPLLFDMPTMGRGKGSRLRVNMAELALIVRQCEADAAIIEEVSAMPGQGVTSMFSFGESYGIAQMAIVAAGLPIQRVQPRSWKGHFGLSREKDQSRTKAIELYPAVAEQLARKKDNGRAEALLIARWYQDHQREACAVSAGKEKPASSLLAQLGG